MCFHSASDQPIIGKWKRKSLKALESYGKISKRTVDALKPSKVGVKGSEQFLWDSELRGFGVRVSPAGLKSFIVQYRTPEGRHRRTVIGRYGLMTP